MKTSALLRPVRAASGNTRLWIQSRLARVDARQVKFVSVAIPLAIAILAIALPAISALQGNTTASDVSADAKRTRSVAIGDIDGDGIPDLVVGNEGNQHNQLFIGNGAGGFNPGVNIGNLQENTDSVDLADIDQDGDLDLVIGNRSTAQPNRLYTWDETNSQFLLRDVSLDDAAWQLRVTSTVRFGDVNNDGDPDVVVANRDTQNMVFYGSGIVGEPGFPTWQNLNGSGSSDSSSAAVGNLSADNCPDLVVANRRNARNDLYINAANCSGYNARQDLSPDADYTDWIEIADINDDGNNDVITANRLQRNKYLLGNGNGTFQPSKAISPDADYTRDIRAVDVDGDGDLDIIAANGAPAPNKLYLNRLMESGILGFDAAIALPSTSDDAIAIGVCGPPDCDLDGDGDVDLVFGNNAPIGSILGAISRIVFNNNETPLFTSEPIEGATVADLYNYEVTAFDPDRAQTLEITRSETDWLSLVDNGDGTATLSGTPTVGGAYNVSLTVTDDDGLTANQNFSVNVAASNAAPSITSDAPPASVTQGDAQPAYNHSFTATDPDDAGDALSYSTPTLPSWLSLTDNDDGTASLDGIPAQIDIGSHDVIVRVTDAAGRIDEQAFVVDVIDGNDRPVAVDDNIQTTNGATVTQLGPQEPDMDAVSLLWNDTDADYDVLSVTSVTINPTAGTVTVNANGTFEYIHGGGGPGTDSFRYRITDGNGTFNLADVSISIDVAADTLPPVITLVGDAVVTVTLGGTYTDAGATAIDDVDGDLTAEIETVNPVDVNTEGSYTVTYNVSDAAGNVAIPVTRTVNVVANPDAAAPVITLVGDAVVQVIVGGTYTDAGATALDDVDGDITADIVTVNPVDANTLGSYTVTYNVSDAAGNAAIEVTRQVNVVAVADTTAPVITRLGSASVSLTVGTAYTDAGATAVDDVDGDITASIVTTNPVNTATAGTYTVRYNVSDASGNAATEVTRTVTVTPPPPRNSGGGSTGVLELLGMILLAGMSRRRTRLTRRSI